LGVFLILGLFVFLYFNQKRIKPKVALSSQQKELVDQFGYPTTFTLVFGEMTIEGKYQPARLEIWNYDEIGRRFYFVDGQFAKDEDIPFREKALYPDLRPTWFDQETTFEQVKKIIGLEPRASAEFIPEIIKNGKVYDFYGQVKVAVVDGKIIYLETYPVLTEKTE